MMHQFISVANAISNKHSSTPTILIYTPIHCVLLALYYDNIYRRPSLANGVVWCGAYEFRCVPVKNKQKKFTTINVLAG